MRRGEPLAITPGSRADGIAAVAPVAGRIVAIARGTVLGGRETAMIVLEAEPVGPRAHEPDPLDLLQLNSALKLLPPGGSRAAADALRRGGVWADRWTSPDLLAQLEPTAPRAIDVVLCNALDLDPVLPLQRTLATTAALEVAGGLTALAKVTGARQAFLAVAEDTPAEGVRALRSAAESSGVRLFPLPDEYPLAHPSLLVHKTTGRRVPPGELPSAVGVLVLDAAAARAAARRLLLEEPMLEVPVGIYDRHASAAHLLWAPVGTTVADLFDAAGISMDACAPRQNHVLRELIAAADDVIAGGESVLFADRRHHAGAAAACLRCGWCVEACPVRIHPAGLLDAAQQNDRELALRYGLPSCIDCGICSYVCPSRLPLLPSIRGLRG